jgi:Domain of unknown function (DUF5615)
VKIKVDDTISASGANLLRENGHDVATVREQGLSGSPDDGIFQVCSSERRTLVTLDRDFGHVPRFHLKTRPASSFWSWAVRQPHGFFMIVFETFFLLAHQDRLMVNFGLLSLGASGYV